jgi:hypothetical protein
LGLLVRPSRGMSQFNQGRAERNQRGEILSALDDVVVRSVTQLARASSKKMRNFLTVVTRGKNDEIRGNKETKRASIEPTDYIGTWSEN